MDWSKVITQPLGLAAFALALVFGVIGVKLNDRQKPWFLPVALILAAFVLVACLYLAHQQVSVNESAKKTPLQQAPAQSLNQPELHPTPLQGKHGKSQPNPSESTMHQETHGTQSPAIQGVQGNVTIIIDSGKKSKE